MQLDEPQRKFLLQWEDQLQSIFGSSAPERAEWTALGDIEQVMGKLSRAATHMFLPTGGGEDLEDCRANDGLIEWTSEADRLDYYASAARPVRLSFWNPGKQTHEAHFILECGALGPVIEAEYRTDDREEIVELAPDDYAPRSAWDAGEYRGESLPDTARLLTRYIKPARFAIFSKGSIYNLYRGDGFDAYMAVHNDPAAFGKIVSDMAQLEYDFT